MFCTQCGSKLKEDAVFCTNCGARQKAKPAAEAPKVAETEAPKIVKTEAPKVVKTEAPKVVKTEAPKVVKTEVPKVAEAETPKLFTGFSVAGSLSDEEPEIRKAPVKAPEPVRVAPVEASEPKVIFSAPAPKKAEPAPRPAASAPRTAEPAPRPAASAPRTAEPAPRPAAPAPRPAAPAADATPPRPAAPRAGAPRPATPASPVTTDWNYSFFDGGLLGLIGVNLVVSLVSLITLGFAWPALTCFRLRWIYKHTCIGGYRLKFTGKGIQLFGRFWLWVLLSIITATIYTWWVPIKYKKWETKHVVIDSMIPQARR